MIAILNQPPISKVSMLGIFLKISKPSCAESTQLSGVFSLPI
jgi:hypothetical protein